MSDLSQKLDGIAKLERKIQLQKGALVNQALHSTDPSALLKAANMIEGIEKRTESPRKSLVFDPMDYNNQGGYKNKPLALTYGTLRRISYCVPIIRAIINTRINQITAFCQPQVDKYSTGFIIRKKRRWFEKVDKSAQQSKAEAKRIDEITEAILNCGTNNSFNEEDFDEFTRKVFNDSYMFDQLNFECMYTNAGEFHSFASTDASTIRIADSFNNEQYEQQGNPQYQRYGGYAGVNQRYSPTRGKVMGHYPSYCQVINDQVEADFYPWEMCFGVRNPTSSIYANGYGIAEIEILINTITSMLWGEEYNRRFFSQGSAPKGLFKVKGGMATNTDKIASFRQQWQSMMAGVYNSWKTPVVEADMEWIDLQKTNRDMEYAAWIEFLIKVSCAVFSIDPAEINFPLSGGSEQKAMFEGNNEARLKHSRDKGLRPALKFYERKLNKYVVNMIDPDYELVFMGLDITDPGQDLDRDIKAVGALYTIDQIRIANGEEPLGEDNGGNIVLNPIWYQWYMGKKQEEMQRQQQGGGGGYAADGYGDTTGDLSGDPAGGDGVSTQSEDQIVRDGQDDLQQQNADGAQGAAANNPIQKALEDYLKTL